MKSSFKVQNLYLKVQKKYLDSAKTVHIYISVVIYIRIILFKTKKENNQ